MATKTNPRTPTERRTEVGENTQTVTPEQIEAGRRAVLENFNPPDDKHSTWWINPDVVIRAAVRAMGFEVSDD